MPNLLSPPIFPSCAAPRIRRKWWRAPMSSGLTAIGIADRNCFAGVVRAYDEARKQNIKLLVGTRLVTDRRVRGAGLSDRPRSLWPALPPHHRRQSQSQERRMPSDLRADSQRQRRPDFYRLAAANAVVRDAERRFHRPSLRLGPRRAAAAPSSPACIIIAATSRAGSGYWPNSARGSARRSSPSTTFSITPPDAGRSPTCSPACAKNARSPKRACGLPSMPNGISNRLRKWRGCSHNFPDAIARTVEIAQACRFSLGELQYEYPDEPVPEGKTAQQHLEDLTWAGARERYPMDRYPQRHSRRRAKPAAR